MEFLSNLTLEVANKPFLLDKRIRLLEEIGKTGSISKAAKEVPLSYKAAWEALDLMNGLSPHTLVLKETGGKGGGGTKLTPYARKLLIVYQAVKIEQARFLENLKKMTDIDNGTLKTIGRFTMQLSARNQLQGSITEIEKGSVNSIVSLKIKSGNIVNSVITNSSVENLNLKVQDDVLAIFKSSVVLLTKDMNITISARNKLKGKIDKIDIGSVNAKLSIDFGSVDKISSVITIDSVEDLGFKVGDTVLAIVKASDVMIGK